MSAVTVLLPPALAALFRGGATRTLVEAATVADAIAALDARWPGMRDRIVDSTPAIRRHINIFVAGERAALGTPLASGAEMIVMTAISGG